MEAWPDESSVVAGRRSGIDRSSGRRPGVRWRWSCRPCSPRPCSCATPPATGPSTGRGPSPWRCSPWPRSPWPPGTSTGWDNGTFRVFYLFGAVLNVPWLAMGTVYLLASERTARRVLWGLVLFSGFAAGVLLSCPMETVHGTAIPVGKDVFGALPRVLAAVGSGVAAAVIIAGRSGVGVAVRPRSADPRPRAPRRRQRPHRAGHAGALERRAGPGAVGHDEAFAISLAVGISDRLLRVRARQRAAEVTPSVAKSHAE